MAGDDDDFVAGGSEEEEEEYQESEVRLRKHAGVSTPRSAITFVAQPPPALPLLRAAGTLHSIQCLRRAAQRTELPSGVSVNGGGRGGSITQPAHLPPALQEAASDDEDEEDVGRHRKKAAQKEEVKKPAKGKKKKRSGFIDDAAEEVRLAAADLLRFPLEPPAAC